jgi:GTP-binding protein Era
LTEKQNKKCLTVALAGIPNAGKSTLMNNLVGEKISIVSPKVQTTRDLIRGILVENNSQIIFIDTPGIFTPKKARMLEKKIVKTAWTGIMDAEVVCLLIDVIDGKRGERIKKINIEARQEISKLTERKVHLFLFVKVKEDWIAKKW